MSVEKGDKIIAVKTDLQPVLMPGKEYIVVNTCNNLVKTEYEKGKIRVVLNG